MDFKHAAGQNKRETTYPASYIIWLVVGLVLLALSLAVARVHQLTGWQLSIFHWFNGGPNSLRIPALLVTEGLGAVYPIALCILIPLLFKRFRLAWRFLAVVGATGVTMEIAKMIAKEPRPDVLLRGNLHVRATETGLTSFPSGHEAVATAMALTLWLILPSKWRWLSVLWIVIMAVSRLYLGVHQPIDVIGGFAIGLVVVCVARLLPPSLLKVLRFSHDKDRLLARH